MPSALLIHGITSSGTTWWRVGADLEDLGWSVRTPTLLGHGGTPFPPDATDPLTTMADAVADELDRDPVDLLLGHSLGALVALTLVAARPRAARVVLLEDPVALNGIVLADLLGDPVAEQRRAIEDPDAEVLRVLEEHPLWSPVDARHSVANHAETDIAAMVHLAATTRWDLPALVAASPVPVHVLAAAGESSTFVGPEQRAVESALGPDRITTVASGHSIHRDRPGLWLQTVLRVARSVS